MYSKFALHVYVCVCVLTCAHSAAQSCPTLHKIHQQIFQPYQVDVLIDVLQLLLLSRFSHVRLCVTPQAAAHQAPLSLGLSRQEHWSVLPFPSLMRESEVAQSCPTLCDPMYCSLPGSSVHGIFQARVLKWGAIAFSKQMFQIPGNKQRYGPYFDPCLVGYLLYFYRNTTHSSILKNTFDSPGNLNVFRINIKGAEA